VGLELNNGAMLAWLVAREYSIFGIQPKNAQRFRDIYRPSGSKDDRIYAFVLADFVRINKSRLKPWFPPSKITLELGELLRWREELVQQRTAAYQRLSVDTAHLRCNIGVILVASLFPFRLTQIHRGIA